MARFLHGTTLTWREDDGTGAARDGELTNPDLSGVEAVPSKYWKVAGGSVVEMTTEEKAVVDAAELTAAKVAKMAAIDANTATLVSAGVSVATGKTISTSLAATQNLQNLWIGFQQGIVTLPKSISTTDGGTYTITDNADLIRIAALLRDFQLTIIEAGQSLRADVLAATTLAGVAAVEDSR